MRGRPAQAAPGSTSEKMGGAGSTCPSSCSRDGVRTPMPWDAAAPHGGFTTGEPWLPLSPGNIARAVSVQAGDPQSLLAHARAMIALRNAHAALRQGSIEDVRARGALLTFVRRNDGEAIHCAFNIGSDALRHKAPAGTTVLALNGADAADLPGWGVLLTRL